MIVSSIPGLSPKITKPRAHFSRLLDWTLTGDGTLKVSCVYLPPLKKKTNFFKRVAETKPVRLVLR